MREHATALSRRIGLCALALAVSAGLAIPAIPTQNKQAFAVTAAEKQAEAEAALNAYNAMNAKIGEAEASYGAAMVEQAEAQSRMDEAQGRIEEASGQITDLQNQLGTRAKSMYKTGATNFLDLLLGASTFQAFTTNWGILNDMNENDAEMVEQTKELRAEVEEEKTVFEEQERIAAQKTEEMEKILAETKTLAEEQKALHDSLSAEAAQLLAQEEAARQQPVVDDTPSGGYSAPAYVPDSGNAIVDRARSWVGRAEYSWGACSPGAFDCSGFVSYCLTGSYSRLGTTYTFLGWGRVSDPQPGDVCVNEAHCGIYVGGGQMIHAATYGVGVVQGPVQGGMVYVRY